MKKVDSPRPFAFLQSLPLIFGLIAVTSSAQAHLPKQPFPLGRPDLIETRTVKEIRQGVIYVRIERGTWGKDGPPKLSFSNRSGPVLDQMSLTALAECLKRAGHTVHKHRIQQTPDSEPYYVLTAGEFNNRLEAEQALRRLPCGNDLLIVEPYTMPLWDTGPYAIDIVIVDPTKYQGKIVSSWSGRAWRASPLELSRKYNAAAAVNGSWFEYSMNEIGGVPSGISIVQGEWHHEPNTRGRAVYIENQAGGGITLKISEETPPLPQFKYAGGKSVTIDGIDRLPGEDEFVAMRPEVWTTSNLSHAHPKDVMGYDITRVQLTKEGELKLERPKYLLNRGNIGGENNVHLVLMASGSKRIILEEAMASGHPSELDLRVPGRPGLNALYTAHVFIRDGKPLMELKRPASRWPLTFIGNDAEGKIYLIYSGLGTTKDPRVATSWKEILDLGLFLKLTNLANMDSGLSSASMVVDGKDVDSPHMEPYDEDRKVADSILVVD